VNINLLTEIFKAEVIKNKPELNDFSTGSVVYTLGRAVSATVLEVYNDIEILRNSGLLFSDNISTELVSSISPALIRGQGTKAKGYLLVNSLTSSNITITPGSIITHPRTLKQYKIIETENTIITPIVEFRLEVEALEIGLESNLPAGTNLISIEYPRIVFIVGSTRDINYKPVGDITGGTSIESIESYRQRIENSLLNNRVTQKQVLINNLALQYPDITHISIQTIANGLITIWINSPIIYTSNQLNIMNNNIQEFLPIGVYSQVKQQIHRIVSVRLLVYEELSNSLISFIQQLVTNYINNKAGRFVSVNAIRNLISDRTGIIVRVLSPTETIEITENDKLIAGTVEVLYVQS